jgi:hypothetical protein
MSASQPDPRYLHHESSDLSTSSTLHEEGQAQSPVQRRAGYSRLDSWGSIDENARSTKGLASEEEDIADTLQHASQSRTQGLGIASAMPPSASESGNQRASVSRVPVGSKSPPTKSPSSTTTTPGLNQQSPGFWSDSPRIELQPQYMTPPDHAGGDHNHRRFPSISSFHSEARQPFIQGRDSDPLNPQPTPSIAASHRSAYEGEIQSQGSVFLRNTKG